MMMKASSLFLYYLRLAGADKEAGRFDAGDFQGEPDAFLIRKRVSAI